MTEGAGVSIDTVRRIDLRQDLSEKVDDALRVDVGMRVQPKVEANIAAIGGDTQSSDGGTSLTNSERSQPGSTSTFRSR